MTAPIRYVVSTGRAQQAFDIAYILAKAVGGPYEILVPLSEEQRYPNGSFAGPIRMLIDGEADVALLPMIYTEEASKVYDFTYPYLVEAATFMVLKNVNVADFSSIFKPFSFGAWIALLVSSFVMSFLLYALLMKKCRFSHILNNILCSLLQQSARFKIEREKWFMFTWFLGVLFLTCCYLSLLLSFLTFPPKNDVRDIQKLAEAVRNGKYEVFSALKVMITKLLESDDESMKIIGKNMEDDPSRVQKLNVFVLSKWPNSAYISARNLISLLEDRYFISTDYFYFYTISFILRKGFNCTEKITMAIHRITAAGLLSRIVKKSFSEFVVKIKEHELYEEEVNMSLTLTHLEGAFMILGIGLSLAFCTLLIEIIVKRCAKY